MTEEEINSIDILDFINRREFVSLTVSAFEGRQYWEITFMGSQSSPGGWYEWMGSKSPQKFFKIFKPKP